MDGSTNFEEQAEYEECLDTENDELQAAKSARGATPPKQPTLPERAERNLSHTFHTALGAQHALPAQAKRTFALRRSTPANFIQVDLAYMKVSAERQQHQ